MAIGGLGSGIGAKLSDGTTDYETVLSLSSSGQGCSSTDISHSGSDKECAEFLPGLIDAGSIICVLRYGSTAGTVANGDFTTLSATFLAREIDTWTLTIPGDATWVATGFISRLGQSVHYKGGTQIQIVIKCTGLPAYTAAS